MEIEDEFRGGVDGRADGEFVIVVGSKSWRDVSFDGAVLVNLIFDFRLREGDVAIGGNFCRKHQRTEP